MIEMEHAQFGVAGHKATDLHGQIESDGQLELLHFVGVFAESRQGVETPIIDVLGGVLFVAKQQVMVLFLVGESLAVGRVEFQFRVFGQQFGVGPGPFDVAAASGLCPVFHKGATILLSYWITW